MSTRSKRRLQDNAGVLTTASAMDEKGAVDMPRKRVKNTATNVGSKSEAPASTRVTRRSLQATEKPEIKKTEKLVASKGPPVEGKDKLPKITNARTEAKSSSKVTTHKKMAADATTKPGETKRRSLRSRTSQHVTETSENIEESAMNNAIKSTNGGNNNKSLKTIINKLENRLKPDDPPEENAKSSDAESAAIEEDVIRNAEQVIAGDSASTTPMSTVESTVALSSSTSVTSLQGQNSTTADTTPPSSSVSTTSSSAQPMLFRIHILPSSSGSGDNIALSLLPAPSSLPTLSPDLDGAASKQPTSSSVKVVPASVNSLLSIQIPGSNAVPPTVAAATCTTQAQQPSLLTTTSTQLPLPSNQLAAARPGAALQPRVTACTKTTNSLSTKPSIPRVLSAPDKKAETSSRNEVATTTPRSQTRAADDVTKDGSGSDSTAVASAEETRPKIKEAGKGGKLTPQEKAELFHGPLGDQIKLQQQLMNNMEIDSERNRCTIHKSVQHVLYEREANRKKKLSKLQLIRRQISEIENEIKRRQKADIEVKVKTAIANAKKEQEIFLQEQPDYKLDPRTQTLKLSALSRRRDSAGSGEGDVIDFPQTAEQLAAHISQLPVPHMQNRGNVRRRPRDIQQQDLLQQPQMPGYPGDESDKAMEIVYVDADGNELFRTVLNENDANDAIAQIQNACDTRDDAGGATSAAAAVDPQYTYGVTAGENNVHADEEVPLEFQIAQILQQHAARSSTQQQQLLLGQQQQLLSEQQLAEQSIMETDDVIVETPMVQNEEVVVEDDDVIRARSIPEQARLAMLAAQKRAVGEPLHISNEAELAFMQQQQPLPAIDTMLDPQYGGELTTRPDQIQLPASLLEAANQQQQQQPSNARMEALVQAAQAQVEAVEEVSTTEPMLEPAIVEQNSTEVDITELMALAEREKLDSIGTEQREDFQASKASKTGSMKQQVVECKYCLTQLKSYGYMLKHVKKLHADEKDSEEYVQELRAQMRTPCPICNKVVSSVSNISAHIQQCHSTVDSSILCPVCGKRYKTAMSLRQHLRQCHRPTRTRWECDVCKATFTEKRTLTEHVNCAHETTQMFPCSYCQKTFLTKGRLRRHKFIHGEHRYNCEYCDKGFVLRDNMNKHIEIMHEQRMGKRFSCPQCPKKFTIKGNMMQHILAVHLKQLPYNCPICPSLGFRRKQKMLEHMHEVHPDAGDQVHKMEANEAKDLEMRVRAALRPHGITLPVTSAESSLGGAAGGEVQEEFLIPEELSQGLSEEDVLMAQQLMHLSRQRQQNLAGGASAGSDVSGRFPRHSVSVEEVEREALMEQRAEEEQRRLEEQLFNEQHQQDGDDVAGKEPLSDLLFQQQRHEDDESEIESAKSHFAAATTDLMGYDANDNGPTLLGNAQGLEEEAKTGDIVMDAMSLSEITTSNAEAEFEGSKVIIEPLPIVTTNDAKIDA